MNPVPVIQSQYLAALAMLQQAVENCPPDLWLATAYPNKFWHVAYHVLFYTHLYLQESQQTFTAWQKHQKESNFLSATLPFPPHNPTAVCVPYTRAEVLEYTEFCRREVQRMIPLLDFDSPESGFPWLPFGKLELQIYNIRHLMQHTGELCERLGVTRRIDVDWVGMHTIT